MKIIRIKNYIISEPIDKILYNIRTELGNKKLRDIHVSGSDIRVTCPNSMHAGGNESNPDCHINIDDTTDIPYGFFHCFSCSAAGTFIKFVALCFDSSMEFAESWLISNYGVKNGDALLLEDDIFVPTMQKEFQLDTKILDNYLTWTPYFSKRKLSEETCNKFNLRYDSRYRQVIFPVYDKVGRLKMLAKRNIDTKVFYLDKDREKEVYCLNYIVKNNITSAVICEGPFDCLTAYEYGVPAIATLGAPSEYQIKQINNSCISVLYLCMDNDSSGQKFNNYIKSRLNPRILTIDVKFPYDKKDINDLSKEEFLKMINK